MSDQAERNPNRDTWGRRCKLGCESWPDSLDFKKCLRCGEPTERYSNLDPLPMAEAQSMLNHARFNAYYSRHCETRGIPVAGPLPEWFEEHMEALPSRLLKGSYVGVPPAAIKPS